MSPLSKMLIALGLFLVVVGLLVSFSGFRALFGWFGHLPGDVNVERGNVRVYAPIVSMLLVSVVFSLLFRLFRQFF